MPGRLDERHTIYEDERVVNIMHVSTFELQRQSNESELISYEVPNHRDYILNTRIHTTNQY